MSKYKCNKCGNKFQGDFTTDRCPKCGSDDIELQKPYAKYAIIAVSVLLAIVIMVSIVNSLSKEEPVASLAVKGGNVEISVSGVSASKLSQNYVVNVFDSQTNLITSLPFLKNSKIATLASNRMIMDMCYSFSVQARPQASIPMVKWITSQQYCTPANDGGNNSKNDGDRQTILTVSAINSVPDRTTKAYTITIVIDNVDAFNDISYALTNDKNKIVQTNNPVFHNIKSGTYTIDIVSGDGQTLSQPLILKDIKELQPAITKEEFQSILNQVASGAMSSGEACDKLNCCSARLKQSTTKGKEQVYDILQDAEANGIRYTIVSFDINPNDNSVVNGSVVVKIG